MARTKINGTGETPLQLADILSEVVNKAWDSGAMMERVTPVTADLLKYWFSETFTSERSRNFHAGQRQAILNAIYCHEVLQAESMTEVYATVGKDLMTSDFLSALSGWADSTPQYCIKMATGTGKTWVLNALLIWQYLNAAAGGKRLSGAQATKEGNRRYTKNFLLVAPGLIVYERLLDAFKGKLRRDGQRDFNTSDLKSNEDLFVPDRYRQSVYSFVQNSVADKADIGRKTTGDGLIAITNWHLLNELLGDEVEETVETAGFSFAETRRMAKELLPITPGTTSGNSLETLDARALGRGELNYLASLPNICVFNDEAHHIYGNDTDEKRWKQVLNYIAEGKTTEYLQVDFTATPYWVRGAGKKAAKHFFPHIIVDFDLTRAMRGGLVKSFVLDKRKEIATLGNDELNFKSVREGKKVISLSDGQRVMLRAGLSKLRILEEHFSKSPKMMVICEDTNVSPLVVDFLQEPEQGLAEGDVLRIDSNRQGDVKPDEWAKIKQELFAIDQDTRPKVIVSVLMLREGFDVNNICVIVPLRASKASILLEQTLGRGLRLMWREPEYADIKAENRRKLYDLKQAPTSLHDILYVVEHPAFERYYQELDSGLFAVDRREEQPKEAVLGDIISVGLKGNYADYDLFIPVIKRDKEETLRDTELSIEELKPYDNFSLAQLKGLVYEDTDERFVSQEVKVGTRFGEYRVTDNLFTAMNYNEYLQRLTTAVTTNMERASSRSASARVFPLLQFNQVSLVRAIDRYIRNRLFGEPFDPMRDNNWRLLMVARKEVVEHIMKQVCEVIDRMQTNIDVTDAVVEKFYFSTVPELRMRENYALDIVKSIYEKTAYPSNKGGFERDFLEACDADGEVERLIKINEHKHDFASLRYVRTDGMLSSYYPDFMVKLGERLFVVETKSAKDAVGDPNVQAKRRAAAAWAAKINELKVEDRMEATWHYVLLDDTTFYTLHEQGASIRDICMRYTLTEKAINSELEL